MNVVVTGATGFIGRPLCAHLLALGHRVTVLSRDTGKAQATLDGAIKSLEWGAQAGDTWKKAVGSADAVIHLAGESVAGAKWTPDYKAKILSSRVESTRLLVGAICETERKPAVLISTSAIGYYGDRKDEAVTEKSAPNQDFLAQVCVAWEAEARKAETSGIRVVRMRVGIVLGEGGALEKMLHPLPLPINTYKLGAGGAMGSGRQWVSWVHMDDVIGLYTWALQNTQVQGAVNVTAPNPVTNAAFAHAIGQFFHRPTLVPIPAFALRALLGEFAESLLTGQKALPEVAEKLGYDFKYVTLEAALRAILQK